ncbi:stage V sporulation protein AA [Gottschalkia purinilytica]|uniref:Stage V sporulation protein AA n=2 Tax=Gottschalkia purinilytica TaxID=1503 RepID=A0A0L0WCQ9_GOTPU|nr:stage V sporulation protein AA [Gottschalkia purinilytica]
MLKIKDVASIFCNDEKIQDKIANIDIEKTKESINQNKVIPVLKVIDIIHKNIKDIDIVAIGEPEILVSSKKNKGQNKIFQIFKVILVSILLFFGAALAITNFHSDVNIEETFKKMYFLITGEKSKNLLIIQIPYSIGIGAGMTSFFNHIFAKKSEKEPSPLEVEMYLYDKDVDEYILDSTKHN